MPYAWGYLHQFNQKCHIWQSSCSLNYSLLEFILVLLSFSLCLVFAVPGFGELSGDKMWTNAHASFSYLRIALIFVTVPRDERNFIVFHWPFPLWRILPHKLRNQCADSCQLPSMSAPILTTVFFLNGLSFS